MKFNINYIKLGFNTFFWQMKRKLDQLLLGKFLKSSTSTAAPVRIPQYFIFNYENFECQFSDIKPTSMIESIEIGGAKTQVGLPLMNLVLNIKQEMKVEVEAKDPVAQSDVVNKSQVGLLISHLQKCIRKCRPDLAVYTTRDLLHYDPIALLRRLPIIMIEDCILMQEIVPLIWLMLHVSTGCKRANQLFETEYIKNWIYRLVYTMAFCPIREQITAAAKAPTLLSDRNIVNNIKDDTCRSIFWAMKIRYFYGGMKGDMKMISTAINQWYACYLNPIGDVAVEQKMIFSCKEILPSISDVCGTHGTHKTFRKLMTHNLELWDLDAVDFHCSNIINHLCADIPTINAHLWKKVLWHCESSLTNKQPISNNKCGVSQDQDQEAENEKLQEIFCAHLTTIRKWQKVILFQIFKEPIIL